MSARLARYTEALAAVLVVLGIWLGIRGVEPVATWLYVACWYPTIALLLALIARREGRDPFSARPLFALSLFAWSAVFWFVFELINWRLDNWYYVFVPSSRPARWAGISLAFATVLPAIFLAARALESRSVFGRSRTPPLVITRAGLGFSMVAGGLFLVLALIWPGRFFPLVWGAATLLAEPLLYLRAPRWSLVGDLERGDPRRIYRLLLGGAAIGLLWEFYNSFARSRWIYTVPGLEELKLFEMPLLGFVGFPVFALECWSVFHLLASYGISTPEERLPGPIRVRRKVITAALGVAFSVFVLAGMERHTISSTMPSIADVPGLPGNVASKLAASGESPFTLSGASPADLARVAGAGVEEAARWLEEIRLVTLRGIGTAHARRLAAIGVSGVRALAAQDPDSLAVRLRSRGAGGDPPFRPTRAEVRVWVRAALAAAPASE